MDSSNFTKKSGAMRIPISVVNSMESIIDYLWSDEFQDYQSRTPEARKMHVFRDILRVRRFLNKKLRAIKQGS